MTTPKTWRVSSGCLVQQVGEPMLDPAQFLGQLEAAGIQFSTGIPDSVLGGLCTHLAGLPAERHRVASNEGQAVALAAGYHFATGRSAMVYMQNSGLGNAINPLISLADSTVYGVPMVLLIGWRGEPGTTDEPQHLRQGGMTIEQLELLGIPARILPGNHDGVAETLARALEMAREQQSPYAIVVRPDTFVKQPRACGGQGLSNVRREQVIEHLLGYIDAQDVVVATTGHAARELTMLRQARGERGELDFLNIGAMGHASQVALGIATAQPHRRVWCLDGDGAALMHLGALAAIGQAAPPNLVHVILNNGAHDSVGGQPTSGRHVDFAAVARACGYHHSIRIDDPDELDDYVEDMRRAGPVCLDIHTAAGARPDLGRPLTTPEDRKITLMANLLRTPAGCVGEDRP